MNYTTDILVYDLETPKYCFIASFWNREEEKFYDFLINRWQNDLYNLIKFLEVNKLKYFCGYNTLKFDNQVLEFIWRNYEKWYNKSAIEISTII